MACGVTRSSGHARSSRALAAAFALLAAPCTTGCNALVDTSTVQCDTTTDCLDKGAAFAGTFCSTEKICRAAPVACTTHRECAAALGKEAFCRPDGTCTPLKTDECDMLIPADALSRDEVILTGFMAPLRGLFRSYGMPLRQGAELAFREIERMNGISGVAGGPQRHLALLVCHDTSDDASSVERPLRVARHLVDALQVPAIIGPADSKAVAQVATEVTTPDPGVVTISPAATDPALANLHADGLVWRTVPSDQTQMPALIALLYMVTADLKQIPGFPDQPRFAYVARKDSEGEALSLALLDGLRKSGISPQQFSYGEEVAAVDWSAKADEIVQAHPDIVLVFSSTEFVTELLPLIEQRWASATKPYYLLTKRALVPELLVQVERNSDLGKRVLGYAPGARNSALFADFKIRFQLAFEAPGNLAEYAYDASYLLAYAMARANVQRPTGRQLAEAMKQLSCRDGTALQAHPSTFLEGFRTAAQNACVNFDGVSGTLDFVADRGEAVNDSGLWCIVRDSAGRAAFRVIDGFYFDAETGANGAFLDSTHSSPYCWKAP